MGAAHGAFRTRLWIAVLAARDNEQTRPLIATQPLPEGLMNEEIYSAFNYGEHACIASLYANMTKLRNIDVEKDDILIAARSKTERDKMTRRLPALNS